ncbi:MAG: SPOR domain-containing protein [Magnetococcales bacterium]|nr:SPOR domain-containing protein [Magnetococcales bacterium]MBF0151253.1 SPOR domain-containing protein [Magnetococcales bacterium]
MTALPKQESAPDYAHLLVTLICMLWYLSVIAWNPVHAAADIQERLAEAQAAIRHAVDRHGPNAIETVPFRMTLAEIYINEGNYSKAEPLLQQALNISTRINGSSDKSLLPILERLAWIDIRNSRFVSGKQFFSNAIDIARRTYGANSAVLQRLYDSLADARQKERLAGNQSGIVRRPTPPTQERPTPVHDLVIANQERPTPPVITHLPTIAATTNNGSGVGVGNEPKSPPIPANSAATTASSPPSGQESVPPVNNNTPFMFGVDLPQKAERTTTPPSNESPKPLQPIAAPVPPAASVTSSTEVIAPPPSNVDPIQSPAPQAKEDALVRQGWYLSVGCFSESTYSQDRLAKVRQLGFPAYTKPARNGEITCVYSGPFSQAADAEAAKRALIEQGGISDTYVRAYD